MAFTLDVSHSSIDFTVRHMMISKVRGNFEKFEGTINLDPNNPENTTVDVTIDPSSINTRDAQRDGHLRTADFLNVEEFPQMRFVSTRVERTGDRTAKLHGDLTIRNVTKPVVLDVEYAGSSLSPWGSTAYGFEADTRINRKDWDLTWNVALETGGVLVSDEIAVHVEVELVQAAEAAPDAATEAATEAAAVA